jgi:FG-GAP-like repeat
MHGGALWQEIAMMTMPSACMARPAPAVATAFQSIRSAATAKTLACILALAVLICAAQPAAAQWSQQGSSLSGSGSMGGANQGFSVAISQNGNTAIWGGLADNSDAGAVWVFTRSGAAWSQQGSKLVGGGVAVGGYCTCADQGSSVGLSADGNTLIEGGPLDNNNAVFTSGVGAAWIFTRTGTTWSQQGGKLVGSSYSGLADQGFSVALSADGNTAIVGGPYNNSNAGAAWIFIRTGTSWSQQAMLVANNASGTSSEQGWSVALSVDGNTAIVGGPGDNGGVGAAWVWTRSAGAWTQRAKLFVSGLYSQGSSVALSGDGNTAIVGGPGSPSGALVFTQSGGVWTQQGNLVGTGTVPSGGSGSSSVALSGDGNTALVGWWPDNMSVGATWVFARTGGVWTQQGSKLVGTGAPSAAYQGFSVALSGDGNTAIEGGWHSNGGLVWVFIRANPTNTHDFNGDGVSDILWSDPSGDVALWLMNGGQVLQSGSLGNVGTSWSVIGQRDFSGDGDADILWRDTNGDLVMWLMNGLQLSSAAGLGTVPSNWTVDGTGDLNANGRGDLLWRDSTTGTVAAWFMNGTQVTGTASYGAVSSSWTIVGDDNNGDIFWRDSAGHIAVWRVNGSTIVAAAGLGTVPSNWKIVGLGDFNGDGNEDILWRDSTTGTVAIWFLTSSLTVQSTASLGAVPANWNIAQTGDYDGDGSSDILWIDSGGNVAVWFMSGGAVSSTAGLGNVGTIWSVQSINSE